MSDHGGTEIRGRASPASGGFEIGSQVGSYRIDARLGEGGMGVVYRATDTKLNREVAIKVLGDHLFDANARRRFQREAQMASALNHPHILTVYDVGEHADRQYLVTELVDGGTLQDWAQAEPHRWRAVVELLVGVADALAAAHDASILHRDVKPANILITKNGYAKLADFGLARLVEDDETRARGTRHTATGAVVGTAAYMSPEQALGRKLDARSDIFTFGVVLYELLAGRHPFASESDVVMLQAVIHSPPPPLPDEIPEALQTVVDKSLEKEPSDRYQSMRELVVDLRRIARKSATDRTPLAPRTTLRLRAWIPWLAVSLTAVALVVALFARRAPEAGPVEASEFVILPPDGTAFVSGRYFSNVAMSPDGRKLAFVAAATDGTQRIWIRPLGSVTAKPLADTDGASGPFWSPDGRSLAFFARGQLRRIDISGGSAQVLADAAFPLGGAWSSTGVIVYSPQVGSPLLSVPASGGETTPVTTLSHPRVLRPSFLPDGRHFVYAAFTDATRTDLEIGSLESMEIKPLLAGAAYAGYAEPGYLLFMRGTSLLAQRFDTARLTLNGDPTLVRENVQPGAVQASLNGVLIYQPGGETRTQLLWTDRSGRPAGIAAPAGEYSNVALSSDGTRVAFNRAASGRQDVWIVDLQRGITSRLTFATGFANVPIWSPDSRYVAFASQQEGGLDIYWHASNLTGTDERVLQLNAQPIMYPSDWSADGKYLTYYRTSAAGKLVEWAVAIGGGDPVELPHEEYNQSQGQFSPDGKWLAYVSDESGMSQVYVQSFPERGGKWQVSSAGGTQPRWARDGKELYFLAPDRKLMAAAVAESDGFEVRGVEPLFATTLDLSALRQTYAVAPDGRFLLNAPVSTSSAPLIVVLNWPALLKK
jgi:serine/threonine protein kinase/Tol biopolymer transport system component